MYAIYCMYVKSKLVRQSELLAQAKEIRALNAQSCYQRRRGNDRNRDGIAKCAKCLQIHTYLHTYHRWYYCRKLRQTATAAPTRTRTATSARITTQTQWGNEPSMQCLFGIPLMAMSKVATAIELCGMYISWLIMRCAFL